MSGAGTGASIDEPTHPDEHVESGQGGLRRDVSLPMLVLYGLGTTVGAGIYALTGEVAGEAGLRAPMSFLVAAALAGVTCLGFAELAGRLPKAAGEAVFVDRAFGRRFLTTGVGIAVLTAGVVAAAAISNAFGGYLSEIVDAPQWVLVLGLIVVLGGLASSGVKESVGAAGVITVIELAGLLLVVWAGRHAIGDAPAQAGELFDVAGGLDAWSGVLGGAFLAFFAFLGFEDMDAVAEETRDAPRTLPLAVLITLAVTAVLYVVVSTTAVLAVPPADLADSTAPLALVFERSGGNADMLAAIAALAMVNGALVQLVMIPRVVYGLTNLGLLPASVGAVSRRTGTPLRATLAATVLVGVLAVSFDIGPLARITSATTMAVFVAVNVSLLVIKRKDGPTPTFTVPGWLPYVAVVASSAMFLVEFTRLVGG
jgi:amino acid transporter